MIRRPATLLVRSGEETVDEFDPDALATGIDRIETLVHIEERAVSEPAGAGEASVADFRVFLPRDVATLDTGDALVVDGEVYEFTGEPWPVVGRYDEVDHVEADARHTGTVDSS
jgi:hypothetical protein